MNIDLKFEISIAKKRLSNHLGIKYKNINSYVVLNRLTAKWAIFNTSLNGLTQVDKKVPILDAMNFLEYFRNKIEELTYVRYDKIDLTEQTLEFNQQYKNFKECKGSIKSLLERKLLNILPLSDVRVNFIEDRIRFTIDDFSVDTHLHNGRIYVENPSPITEIIIGDDSRSLFYVGLVTKVLNDVSLQEITSLYRSYTTQRIQLGVLYREPTEEYNFDHTELVDWLNLGSEGMYMLQLRDSIGYSRKLIVERETKKKHVVKIVNENNDGLVFNEYEEDFLKVAQCSSEISESIHNILKYTN